MPMSAAAMDGIRDNGLRWKHQLSLGGQTKLLGEMTEETPDAEAQLCAERIVERVRAFADRLAKTDPDLSQTLRLEAEDFDLSIDSGIEEVREGMNRLYDVFDYHRICITG